MPSLRANAHFALPAVLFLTGVVAVLPAGWRLGWSQDLAGIVRFPLRPFSHAGNAMAGWLRPAPSLADDAVRADMDALIEELEVTRRRYQDEYERNVRLEEQLQELQQIPRHVRARTRAAVFAYITQRSAASSTGVVELKLEPGVRGPVAAETVAVYASVHLLGRVVGEPGATTCQLLPLTSDATGYLLVKVFPREDPLLAPDQAPLLQLKPTGTGILAGELDRDVVVERGDVVRLVDDRWPDTAQMMVVGEIERVATSDREPLRNAVTVRPRYGVGQVSYVTLLVEGAVEGDDDVPRERLP